MRCKSHYFFSLLGDERPGCNCRSARILLFSALALLYSIGATAGQDSARINADGTIDFTVHYAYPPTSDDINELESTIRAASEITCDATDNNLRYGEVTISAGGGSEATADVWILPPGLWSRSSSSGFLLDDKSRIFLTQGGRSSTTFAHEMAHASLQLPDSYDEQSRLGRYYGIGYSIDAGRCSITGDKCAYNSDCGSQETCVGSDLSAANHSLMGSKFTPPLCSVSGNSCFKGDVDCNGGADQCQTPVLYSEFSTDSYHDPLVGNNTTCPIDRLSEQIIISGRLGALAAVTPFQFTTFDEAKTTSSTSSKMRYIDSLGVVVGYETESSHNLYVYAEHVDNTNREWTLHFIMDGKHLQGETAGEPILVGSIDIDFNGGASTYPATGQAALAMRVCNGGSCRVPGSAGYSNPSISVPATSNGAAQKVLEVAFANGQQLVLRENTSGAYIERSKITASDGGLPIGNCLASSAGDWDELCAPAVCEGMWNTDTLRWEASSAYTIKKLKGEASFDSEWDQIADMPIYYGATPARPEEDAFNAPIIAPAGLPSATSAACANVGDQVIFDTQLSGNDTLIVALDTSKSMEEDYDSFGVTKTRLEWAQSAARALADLVELNNTYLPDPQSIGLVHFSGSASEVFSPDALGLPGNAAATDFHLAVDGLSANGSTALASGLLEASVSAQGHPDTLNPGVVVLTDGEANVCLDGSKCGTEAATVDSIAVVEAFSDAGVDIFFTPIGGQLGSGVFGDAVSLAGGEIYHSDSARDIPMQFARAWLLHSGRSAVMDATKWNLIPTNPNLSTRTFDINVEEGANSLSMFFSSRNNDVDSWNFYYRLRSPSGLNYFPFSPQIETIDDASGSFYRILRVSMGAGAVESGTWEMTIFPMGGVPQSGYAMAWTDTPEPDCYAGLSSPVFRSTKDGVVISAQASWHMPIDGVSYKAKVTRPDGSKINVAMSSSNEESSRAEGVFSNFAGRGIYSVSVSCDINNAQFWYGEDLDTDAQPDPVNAPGFYREAVTAFFLDVDEYPPLPRGNDCDGDGISNKDEGAICGLKQPCIPDPKSRDTDGDGIIDACDHDSDNDDVLDGDEPNGDIDKDGRQNRHDPDSDNDGLLDGEDRYPWGERKPKPDGRLDVGK